MRKGDIRYADFTKVFTRVAYQLIRLDAKRNPELYTIPCKGLLDLAGRLNKAGFNAAAFWVVAYELELLRGGKLASCRERIMRRTDRARTWRHVAYADYKRNRVR